MMLADLAKYPGPSAIPTGTDVDSVQIRDYNTMCDLLQQLGVHVTDACRFVKAVRKNRQPSLIGMVKGASYRLQRMDIAGRAIVRTFERLICVPLNPTVYPGIFAKKKTAAKPSAFKKQRTPTGSWGHLLAPAFASLTGTSITLECHKNRSMLFFEKHEHTFAGWSKSTSDNLNVASISCMSIPRVRAAGSTSTCKLCLTIRVCLLQYLISANMD